MNQYEKKALIPLIKNGKYFVPPTGSTYDFKTLFQKLAAAGAGRPVDKNGFPMGQWTPELLADAISTIDENSRGIELRTVQHWFQENDKGIGQDNIRWLSRIFGCGDPEAASEWLVELSAANRRLAAKRRERKGIDQSPKTSKAGSAQTQLTVEYAGQFEPNEQRKSWRFNLAVATEALFGSQSSMALPLVVFSGACALGLISFTLNIHSVVYDQEGGVSKQVGFLWAPNWTITFLAVLPLYLAMVIDLLRCWNEEWRSKIVERADRTTPALSWEQRLSAASIVFLATFILTVIIASGHNWIATHLIPLLTGDAANWAVDWGRIATLRPDLVSVRSSIIFSGLVFIYNGFTAYVFFAGLILLHLVKHDFVDLIKGLGKRAGQISNPDIGEIGFALVLGFFRCASLGIWITVLMKLQSSFLQSGSSNIIEWLFEDFQNGFGSSEVSLAVGALDGVAPGSYYSFFCLLAIAGTFANASVRIFWNLKWVNAIELRSRYLVPLSLMSLNMVMLIVSYFLIGTGLGFSLPLCSSFILTIYLLVRPTATWSR